LVQKSKEFDLAASDLTQLLSADGTLLNSDESNAKLLSISDFIDFIYTKTHFNILHLILTNATHIGGMFSESVSKAININTYPEFEDKTTIE
jgi:hypothetical protein